MPNRSIITGKPVALGLAALACACLASAAFLGSGFASAGSQGDGSGSFGLSGAMSVEMPAPDAVPTVSEQAPLSSTTEFAESFVLETTAKRDISANISQLEAELEAERLAAEEAERAHNAECQAAAEKAQAEAAALGSPNVYDIDFSIGHDAFVAKWGSRIDAYLEGFPLEGYGTTFAEAAWEYGVDPRWSPAISNTESTRGTNCFRPYNAWGWMGGNWSSWPEAIHAHVKGLAEGYGFTISVALAQKYCPPTYMDWYGQTVNQMTKI